VAESANVRSEVRIGYVGRAEKEQLVRQIIGADTRDIPEGVIRFALLGDEDVAVGAGSGGSRNTALLLSAGELVLSVDDDARFEFSTLAGTRLSEKGPPAVASDREFGEEYAQGAIDSLRRVDLLSGPVHRDVAQWMLTALGPDDASHPSGRRRVRAVMTGIAGNRWYDRLEPPLMSRGEPRDDIYRRKARYRRSLQSGYAVMQSKRYIATEVPFFVTCCSGFDSRDLLPPFPPDLRPDDTVFMWFLRQFDRHGLVAHLPVMVHHDLGPRRPDRFRDPGEAGFSPTGIVTGIIADVVHRSVPNHGEQALLDMGGRFIEIANLSPSDWTEYVHSVWVRSLSGTAIGLERILQRYNGSPEFWAEDVRHYVSMMRAFVPRIPDEARWELGQMQRYIGKLGELLHWWPAIWRAAVTLKGEIPTDPDPGVRS
nr:hypothetical protein [Spirochaeta sp.]